MPEGSTKFSFLKSGLFEGTVIPFAIVIAGCVAILIGGMWLKGIMPPPSERIYIPYQWVCHSKSQGGYCERTGDYDHNGKPWGTAVPRP
jgi:hypothetical protein